MNDRHRDNIIKEMCRVMSIEYKEFDLQELELEHIGAVNLIIVGDNKCYDNDRHYQFGVATDGTIYRLYYDMNNSRASELVDYTNPYDWRDDTVMWDNTVIKPEEAKWDNDKGKWVPVETYEM